MPDTETTVADARLAGLAMGALLQSWENALVGLPVPESPHEHEVVAQAALATCRTPKPIDQISGYAHLAGQVALNHLAILRGALISYSNGMGPCPVSTVDSLTRVAVETYAVQRWLVDPRLTMSDRYARWLCLETMSERSAWTAAHEGEPHRNNPALLAIAADADQHGVRRDSKMEWIGVHPPKALDLTGELISRFAAYEPGRLSEKDGEKYGKLMYRIASGGVHANVGHVLLSLLPAGWDEDDGEPYYTYSLASGRLWRAVATVTLASYAANCEFAAWIGLPVPAEARRLTLHHFDLAAARANQAEKPNS